MNYEIVIKHLKQDVFSRNDLFEAFCNEDNKFVETQMRYHLGKLLKDGLIVRVGRNLYSLSNRNDHHDGYRGLYSKESKALLNDLAHNYPRLKYQIWELNWLNEFLNHLVIHNKIFLEIENEGCEFVYSTLNSKYNGKVLLKPNEKELDYYGSNRDIIINRLVSEQPIIKGSEHEVTLEKMIVDLFANKNLQRMISKGDYPDMLERMFFNYKINQNKLFRYAKRRGKAQEIAEFIKDKTNIKLLVKI